MLACPTVELTGVTDFGGQIPSMPPACRVAQGFPALSPQAASQARENHGGRLGGHCRVASLVTVPARGLAAARDAASCGWTLPSCPRPSPLGRAGVAKLHAPVQRLPPAPGDAPSAQAGLPAPHAPVRRLPRPPSVLVRANRPARTPCTCTAPASPPPASSSAQTGRPELHAPVRRLPPSPSVLVCASRPARTPCTCTAPASAPRASPPGQTGLPEPYAPVPAPASPASSTFPPPSPPACRATSAPTLQSGDLRPYPPAVERAISA